MISCSGLWAWRSQSASCIFSCNSQKVCLTHKFTLYCKIRDISIILIDIQSGICQDIFVRRKFSGYHSCRCSHVIPSYANKFLKFLLTVCGDWSSVNGRGTNTRGPGGRRRRTQWLCVNCKVRTPFNLNWKLNNPYTLFDKEYWMLSTGNVLFRGVLQSLIEKHFPAPDRQKLFSLLGIDLSAKKTPSPSDTAVEPSGQKGKKRKGGVNVSKCQMPANNYSWFKTVIIIVFSEDSTFNSALTNNEDTQHINILFWALFMFKIFEQGLRGGGNRVAKWSHNLKYDVSCWYSHAQDYMAYKKCIFSHSMWSLLQVHK